MRYVIPLYFLPLLSSLPTDIPKQLTSQQHSIQGDNYSINTRLSISMRHRRRNIFDTGGTKLQNVQAVK